MLGVDNWTNGWLPSLYQGTVVRSNEPRILNLDPPPHLQGEAQAQLPRISSTSSTSEHLARIPARLDLEARIASYELAAQDADGGEGSARHLAARARRRKKLYGIDDPATADYGTRCLIARRLVERGVRFVQVFTGNQTLGSPRQHHRRPARGLQVRRSSRRAALVTDLKQRGLLDTHASCIGAARWAACR